MRKIEVKKWKAINEATREEFEENTLTALNVLIAGQKPEDIPRGIDKFRLFGRLGKAFDKAEKSGVLELEESDYSFIKKAVEANVPSVWAMHAEIGPAIEAFLNAEEE